MKSALFAGLAVALLANPLPVLADAAPATPTAPVAPPAAARTISFAQVKAEADMVWNRLDANHDGRIDGADRDVRLLRHFDKWDTNHDGVISKDEFLAFIHAHEGKEPGDHHGPADAAPPPGHREGWHGDRDERHQHDEHGGRLEGLIAMAIVHPAMRVARKDGVITRAAFDAAVKAEFDRIDANHDGILTHEELRAAWRAKGEHRDGPWHHGPWQHGDMPSPPPPPADGR